MPLTIYYWQCNKCCLVERTESSSTRPPASYNGCSHDWKKLGQQGSKVYMCKKCGKTHDLKSSPPGGIRCPKGGTHSWTQLA